MKTILLSLIIAANCFAQTVTPEQFDRGHNFTAALQAAVNVAGRMGGGTVQLGPKVYRITAPIHCSKSNVRIVGSGKATVIQLCGDFGDGFFFSPTTGPSGIDNALVGIEFRDLSIVSSCLRTHGAAIHVAWSDDVRIDGVRIDKKVNSGHLIYDGINLEFQSACHLIHSQIGSVHFGAVLTGCPVTDPPICGYNGLISDCDFWGESGSVNSSAVELAGGNGGISIEGNSNLSHYYWGIHCVGNNREVRVRGAYLDGNADCGFYCENGGAEKIEIIGGWAAACGLFGDAPNRCGIKIVNVPIVNIVSGSFFSNGQNCINISGGGQVILNAVEAYDIIIGSGVTSLSASGGRVSSLTIDGEVNRRVTGILGQADQ